MTANLRVTAEMADAIAHGDLSVEPKPLSDKDTLGLALKEMTQKLRTVVCDALAAAGNVSSGSEELSSACQQLSAGANEQAASAEEVSSSMEQMAANIKQNADNAAQTEKIARQSSADAQASGDAVNRAVAGHADHRREDHLRAGDRAADRPSRAERSRRGGAGGRARQGLCGGRLGGAEARRAEPDGGRRDQRALGPDGDGGARGGRHARRSSCPTSRRRPNLWRRSRAACREQDIGANQVNQAIQQLDKVIQQNAGAAEEMSATSEALSGQAETLQASIAFFRIGGEADMSRPPPADAAKPAGKRSRRDRKSARAAEGSGREETGAGGQGPARPMQAVKAMASPSTSATAAPMFSTPNSRGIERWARR